MSSLISALFPNPIWFPAQSLRRLKLEANIGRLNINLFGYDHHLRAELAMARSLWLRGSSDTAYRMILGVVDKAERSDLPEDHGLAAAHAIPVLLWSGNTEEAGEHIERLVGHAEKHSLKSHAAAARALKGEWLLTTGEPSAAVETLQQGLEMLYREQFRMIIPGASRALAEALARSERHDEARATVDRAISSAREMGQKYWLPELLHTQGQILLAEPSPDIEAADRRRATH
ncbi:tetratricopeptide repeat protein [Pseudochelatococcus sp. B33]